MQFFIDTANLSEIEEAQAMGVVDGVTTNPSLMAKENIIGPDAIKAHYKAICNLVYDNVSAEVIATDFDGMVKEGNALAKIDDKIIVKVPMTKDGVKAIKYLTNQGIRTNCTLVFTTGQAILAAKAGASYVSPFIGRMDDIAHHGMGLITQIAQVYQTFGCSTKVLAASVRHTMHLIRCAEEGADVATAPFQVIEGLFNHPMTDIGLARFLSDFKEVNEGEENQKELKAEENRLEEKIAIVNS
ncbi:MAG TPA: fructose-6-phosphate aldolase [Microscillaceae bacterium]|nr:fructose-6-phosphate aldolase [Microscillaceae bacterium]